MTRFRFGLLPFLTALLLAQNLPESQPPPLPLPETLLARLPEPWRDVSRRLATLTQTNIRSQAKWKVVYGHHHSYSAWRLDNPALITRLLP